MSFAATAVGVIVRPVVTASGQPLPSGEEESVACMMGERGFTPGYWRVRACRLNVSAALSVSPKLQIDVVLAPDGGMTGCWGAQCGRIAKAWLLNALVFQLPGALRPWRAHASLKVADRVASAAVRNWWWCGPFSDHAGQ